MSSGQLTGRGCRDHGNVWRTAIEMPLGVEMEYKLVHVTPGYSRWEEASNHYFKAASQVSQPPTPHTPHSLLPVCARPPLVLS